MIYSPRAQPSLIDGTKLTIFAVNEINDTNAYCRIPNLTPCTILCTMEYVTAARGRKGRNKIYDARKRFQVRTGKLTMRERFCPRP